MELSLIAALARNGAIGKDNDLPWRLPDDLRRFKALTLGKPVLMGRRTAESLGRALPGRRNLVLTRGVSAPFAGMEPVGSLDAALRLAGDAPELCVIGGADVFAATLPLATRLHLTRVDTVVEGDGVVFFPPLDLTQWREVARDAHPADERNAFAFVFVDYAR
jgi:dihydrofolate reductase